MKTSRRGFIGGVISAGAALGFPAITSARSPNAKISHACVGSNGMAGADMRTFAAHPKVEIAAICDVDFNYLRNAKKAFPNARVYVDWREMLAVEGPRIDSVNVSTPDHVHAAAAAAAMRAGKHVYCQKPLCKQLDECALLRRLAAENGIVTQLGTQFAAMPCDRHLYNLLSANVVGPVRKAWIFSTRPGMSRVHRKANAPAPVPSTLDWERWIGPAPMREYAPGYHPTMWRVWRDFGSGWIGDLCTHVMTPVWIGLGLGKAAAKTVRADVNAEAATDPIYRRCWPRYSHITWEFDGVPATGGRPFTVEWTSGISTEPETPPEFLPPKLFGELAAKTPLRQLPLEGEVIEGEKGWILAPHGSASPCVVFRDGTRGPKLAKLSREPGHHHEFIDRCLGSGRETRCDFSWSTYLMDAILLGGVAERLPGKTFAWDAKTRTFDDAAATALAFSHYRDGWKTPGLG